jgi:hypothetical protein
VKTIGRKPATISNDTCWYIKDGKWLPPGVKFKQRGGSAQWQRGVRWNVIGPPKAVAKVMQAAKAFEKWDRATSKLYSEIEAYQKERETELSRDLDRALAACGCARTG